MKQSYRSDGEMLLSQLYNLHSSPPPGSHALPGYQIIGSPRWEKSWVSASSLISTFCATKSLLRGPKGIHLCCERNSFPALWQFHWIYTHTTLSFLLFSCGDPFSFWVGFQFLKKPCTFQRHRQSIRCCFTLLGTGPP